MLHIPPLIITGQDYTATIKRAISRDEDFHKLEFYCDIDNESVAKFEWSEKWRIDIYRPQPPHYKPKPWFGVDEIEIIIPELNKHIFKYNKPAYRLHRVTDDYKVIPRLGENEPSGGIDQL